MGSLFDKQKAGMYLLFLNVDKIIYSLHHFRFGKISQLNVFVQLILGQNTRFAAHIAQKFKLFDENLFRKKDDQ